MDHRNASCRLRAGQGDRKLGARLGRDISVHVLAVLAIDQHPKVEKLKKGDKITITGRIGNAEVLGRTNAELHLDVKEVKIQ